MNRHKITYQITCFYKNLEAEVEWLEPLEYEPRNADMGMVVI